MTKQGALPEPSGAKSPLVPIVVGLVAAAAVACGAIYVWSPWASRPVPNANNTVATGFTALADAKRLTAEATELAAKGDDAGAAAKAREAAAKADEVIKGVGPKHSFGLNARILQATAHRLTGNSDQALKVLDELLTEDALKAVDGKPVAESEMLATAQIERALTLAKLGRAQEGVDALLKTETLKGLAYNSTHVVRMGIAEVYEKAGSYDQARAVYERIIERHEGPEKSWAKQASIRIKFLDTKNPPAKPADDPKAKKVSGLLDGKHVWTKDDGPYQVGETLKVGAGARLEIGPGVVVRFAPGARLEVLGALVAHGGEGEAGEIRFTAMSAARGAFGWEGIELAGGEAAVSHCRIDSARVGLRIRGGAPEIADCRITNCGKAGVHIRPGTEGNGAAPAAPRLVRCLIDHNLGSGVDVQGSVAPKLNRCTIEANGEYGLSAQDIAAPEMTDCRVVANREDGVLFHKSARGRVAGKTVIEGNQGFGLRADLHGEADVSAAVVKANGSGGVSIVGAKASLTGCTIEANCGPGVTLSLEAAGVLTGNTITGNARAGVLADSGARKPQIRGNRISGQPVGIIVRDVAEVVVSGNDLSGNKEYGLALESENFLDARDNYWGPGDADAVRKLVKGPAKFEPFHTAPPPAPQTAP